MASTGTGGYQDEAFRASAIIIKWVKSCLSINAQGFQRRKRVLWDIARKEEFMKGVGNWSGFWKVGEDTLNQSSRVSNFRGFWKPELLMKKWEESVQEYPVIQAEWSITYYIYRTVNTQCEILSWNMWSILVWQSPTCPSMSILSSFIAIEF